MSILPHKWQNWTVRYLVDPAEEFRQLLLDVAVLFGLDEAAHGRIELDDQLLLRVEVHAAQRRVQVRQQGAEAKTDVGHFVVCCVRSCSDWALSTTDSKSRLLELETSDIPKVSQRAPDQILSTVGLLSNLISFIRGRSKNSPQIKKDTYNPLNVPRATHSSNDFSFKKNRIETADSIEPVSLTGEPDDGDEKVLAEELARQQVEEDGAEAQEEHAQVARRRQHQPLDDVGAQLVALPAPALAAHAQHQRLRRRDAARQRPLFTKQSTRQTFSMSVPSTRAHGTPLVI